MNVTLESDRLHERVRRFAEQPSPAAFDTLALDLAAFQARWSPGFARLLARRSQPLRDADEIPAVPAAAFRSARVAVHGPELDELRFVTSGTTAEQRGSHVLRTAATYRALATRFGRRALLGESALTAVVVAIAPRPPLPFESSLAFMMQAFMDDFDGEGGGDDRWLIRDDGVDLDGLRRAAARARERGEPLLVLATSLALLALLERLPAPLDLPEHTTVMQTGGFKGRTVSVDAEELRARVAAAFGISTSRVIGEYGMTELSSQLYELGGPGRYVAPPWLRVSAVDPVSLEKLPPGEVGLARFVDLANVDSAVAVVTDDLIRNGADHVELLGRRTGAPARGCSLALESLLLPASDR